MCFERALVLSFELFDNFDLCVEDIEIVQGDYFPRPSNFRDLASHMRFALVVALSSNLISKSREVIVARMFSLLCPMGKTLPRH